MNKIQQWIADLFTSFQIVKVLDFKTMEEAAAFGCHAALRGNFEVSKLGDGVSKISNPTVLGIKVTLPKSLKDPTNYQKAKIRRFFRSINFIWFGKLVVFDPKYRDGLTDHVNIGDYHTQN